MKNLDLLLNKNAKKRILEVQKLREEFNDARLKQDLNKQDEIFEEIYKKYDKKLNYKLHEQYWKTDWLKRFWQQFKEDFKQEFKFQLLKRISDYRYDTTNKWWKMPQYVNLSNREYKDFCLLIQQVYIYVFKFYTDFRESKIDWMKYSVYFSEIDEKEKINDEDSECFCDKLIDENWDLDRYDKQLDYEFFIEKLRYELICFYKDKINEWNEKLREFRKNNDYKKWTFWWSNYRKRLRRIKKMNKQEFFEFLKNIKEVNCDSYIFLKSKFDEWSLFDC